MRIFAMVIALVLSVVTANAEPITREQARKQAEKFMSGKKKAVKLEAVTSVKKGWGEKDDGIGILYI